MSVVAVRKTDKKIKIAADSISVCGWTRMEKTIKKAKLFKVNGIIAGGVGLSSENLLLENFCLTHQPHEATEREILNFFIEFNNYLKDLGLSKYTNAFILCFKGKAFLIYEDMYVNEINEYAAIGAGEDFALAALYLGHSAKEAVKTACELSAFVAEPIVEFEMEKEI